MKKLFALTFVVGIALFLSGCYTPSVVYVDSAPAPAPVATVVYNTIPIAPQAIILTVGPGGIPTPGPRYVWVDGYWQWDARARNYFWVNGYWTRVPYTEAVWVPGYWNYYNGGYAWVNGGWAPRGYSYHTGYYDGRYDYYGRRVYYSTPTRTPNGAYVYSYDHRPQYTPNTYSSNTVENNRTSTTSNRSGTEQIPGSTTSGRTSGTVNDGRSGTDQNTSTRGGTTTEQGISTRGGTTGTQNTGTSTRDGSSTNEQGTSTRGGTTGTQNTGTSTRDGSSTNEQGTSTRGGTTGTQNTGTSTRGGSSTNEQGTSTRGGTTGTQNTGTSTRDGGTSGRR